MLYGLRGPRGGNKVTHLRVIKRNETFALNTHAHTPTRSRHRGTRVYSVTRARLSAIPRLPLSRFRNYLSTFTLFLRVHCAVNLRLFPRSREESAALPPFLRSSPPPPCSFYLTHRHPTIPVLRPRSLCALLVSFQVDTKHNVQRASCEAYPRRLPAQTRNVCSWNAACMPN